MLEEFYKIKVQDIMTPGWNTPFIEENAGWREFLTILSFTAHAWVVNNAKDMKIVGVITEHDIMHYVIPQERKREKIFGIFRLDVLHKESIVKEIMTYNPVTCVYDETLDDVLKKLSTYDIRRLPVVDKEKRLVGEITIQHLVKNLRYKFMHGETEG
jgi:CBS domain-containing protein